MDEAGRLTNLNPKNCQCEPRSDRRHSQLDRAITLSLLGNFYPAAPRCAYTKMSFWDSLKENEKQNCIGKLLIGTKLRRKWYTPDGAVLKEWNSKIYLAIKTVIHDPGNRVHIFGSSSTHPGFSINLYMMCN